MGYDVTFSSEEVEAIYSAMQDFQRKYKGVRHEHWTDIAAGIGGKMLSIMQDNPEPFRLT